MIIEEIVVYIATTLIGYGISHLINSKRIKSILADRNNLAAALAFREGELLPPIQPLRQAEIDEALSNLPRIDRIATLWACNGNAAPTETTSISIVSNLGRQEDYYRVKLDPEYVSLLFAAEKAGYVCVSTVPIPDYHYLSPNTLLGSIYRDLGIKVALLAPIYYKTNRKYDIKGWLYSSFSRITVEPFTPSEIREILSACRLKQGIYEEADVTNL